MDFVNERPPFGDLFSPPRQTLNVDNEYLCNVGLIILIAGSPTPELPQMIAAKMAELHGGRVADYIVSQASITPYVISCPNATLRDRIVQGGIYSLTQAHIRFTVHEWRPRFGMGYHPPTHQAWIKITGLPLQAWTVPEITSFTQNFGYPLQILPFGRAAGQFIDITALIATMHPTNIPLAYRYMEGDYSAQVDILLLAWRVWSDEHFPPPTDLDRRNDPHLQPHPSAHTNDTAIFPTSLVILLFKQCPQRTYHRLFLLVPEKLLFRRRLHAQRGSQAHWSIRALRSTDCAIPPATDLASERFE